MVTNNEVLQMSEEWQEIGGYAKKWRGLLEKCSNRRAWIIEMAMVVGCMAFDDCKLGQLIKGLKDGPDHYCECIVLDVKDLLILLHRKQKCLCMYYQDG